MKRIAIFSPNYPPELGACSSRIHTLATFLKAQGHQVSIYTTFPNYPEGKIKDSYRKHLFRRLFVKEIQDGIEVVRFPVYPSNSASTWVRLMSMFSLAVTWANAFFLLRKQKPTYIFVQSPPILPVLTVWCLSKIVSPNSFILNLSDLYPQVLKDLGKIKGRLSYDLLCSFEKFIYKKSDVILGQSMEIVSHVKEIVPDKSVFLYRNGVQTKEFLTKKDYKIPAHQPIRIVYAGLLGVVQGLAKLIAQTDFEALQAELHIFGDGNEFDKIAHLIEHKNLEKNVFLKKAVPQKQISQLLAKFDIALIAQKCSIKGTVPSKIYEAMAAGLPVLLIGEGESKMLVEQNQTGIVVSTQDLSHNEALNSAIIRLRKMSNAERQLLGSNGVRTAKTLFEQEKQFEVIKKVIN